MLSATVSLIPNEPPPVKVRLELNEERDLRARLQHTVAKLQSIVVAQTGQDGQRDQMRNPYVDAWYRKENAAKEFENYPPKVRFGSLAA